MFSDNFRTSQDMHEALPHAATGCPATPENEYTRRLTSRERQLAAMKKLHRRLWVYFIVAIIALATVAALAVLLGLSYLWALPPCWLLLASLTSLRRNALRHQRVQRIAAFHEAGLRRVRHQWQGHGIAGENFVPGNHPYAQDLDLFGKASVFELLCSAQTGAGRKTLAKWLLEPAEPQQIEERHMAIRELRDWLDLQENWASLGKDAVSEAEGSAIQDWVNAPVVKFPRYTRLLAIVLPMVLLLVSILVRLGIVSVAWWIALGVPLAAEAVLAACLLKRTRRVSEHIVLPAFELSVIAPLLGEFERIEFRSSALKSLQLQLLSGSGTPSRQIRTLSIYAWLLDLRRSEFFALPSSLVLWGTNLALLVELWRERNREALALWLNSLGTFEALLCFSRYSFENPDHSFPLVKTASSAFFHAESIGHPLLNGSRCVKCDLRLDTGQQQLLIVSGSNMSGKSTLLRTIGVNAALALAGAPVRAARLEMSFMQLGCSIAVHDSLATGRSRFQAEIERLKSILDTAGRGHILILLDEVLGGTNSKDRFFGVKAVINELLRVGAIGLVTTHDLALTELALARGLSNFHFEEYYSDGEMRFDYLLRAGVLSRTNGGKIMLALGLVRSSEGNGP